MAIESPLPAPAVVAVVVTCDPGPWFPEVLASLAGQDYPNLSVLVIDAGCAEDPTPAVGDVMPGAFVRRLERTAGFGTAANEVLDIVEGASHYLLCHDDVVLEPQAVRLMVEEAFRSNAGVATPKYVQWDDPGRLLAVGLTTDKVGARRNLVDPGELDQEQHDAVREVLVAPAGATLIRADLFVALGGFDPVVDSDGEDIDLSWRARLYGARVVTVPSARVRHLQATVSGLRPGPSDLRLRERNRYRTLLSCYRWHTLAWIVPLAVFWALGEAITLVFQGRAPEAGAVLGSLAASLRQRPQLRKARRRVQRHRAIRDHELRSLQVRGNARFRLFVQSRVDEVRSGWEHQGHRATALSVGGPDPDSDGRAVAPPEPDGAPAKRRSLNSLLLTLLAVVLIVGTRSLFGKALPQVGTLPDTSIGWAGIWSSWWSAWQPGGLGVAAPASPAMALLGLLGTVLFGAVGTLGHLVVLGPLVVGPVGAYRAARSWGSPRGRMVAAITYAVVPLPYNSLAAGHWDALVAYAAMPWVLSLLIRLSAAVPVPVVRLERSFGRLVGLGVLVAVVASVGPAFLYIVPIAGLALLAGSVLAGRPLSAWRVLGFAVGGSALAFVLLLPWSATVVDAQSTIGGVDLGPAGRLGLGQILRFSTGPYGTGAWEWLILIAAALPLVVGRGWRLEWAARMWVVALTFFALAWAVTRGWVPSMPVGMLLAPAAAALAGSTALGVAAFEMDLPGYNFGWRQAAAASAGLCLALAAIPLFVAAGSGRWDMPSADASSVLAFLPTAEHGDYRVLWVGHPDALPLAGRQLEPGFAYGTSFDGAPSLSDDWATGSAGAAGTLAADLRLVQGRLTTKLGHLLGPAGIRFLVIPNHVGPVGSGGRAVPIPGALLAGMALQTDLQAIPVGDPDYTVYQNAAWAPVRAVQPNGAVAAAGRGASVNDPSDLRAVEQTDLMGSKPVLTGGNTHAAGPVPSGQTVFVGSTRSGGWQLDAGGKTIRPAPAFGWGMSFDVPPSAAPSVPAHLGYSAPLLVRGGDVLQLVLWVAALLFIAFDRRARGLAREGEAADPAWFVPAPIAIPGGRRVRGPIDSGSGGRRRPSRAPDEDATATESGEVWSDA